MSDYFTKAQALEKQADQKLAGCLGFWKDVEGASKLYLEAVESYNLAESWNEAGATYLKLTECYSMLGRKFKEADAFYKAGHMFRRTSRGDEATQCWESSINCFLKIKKFAVAARLCKEIAEMYESERNLENAIYWYEKAAYHFHSVGVTPPTNQCRHKVAQCAAQLEQFGKAIEIYEDMAVESCSNTLLVRGVKHHLLNAGICHLCEADFVSPLKNYEQLDPTFSETWEYRILSGLASAVAEQDAGKFRDVLEEFRSKTPLDDAWRTQDDAWKTTLLLKVLDNVKA